MASGLSSVALLALCVIYFPSITAGSKGCRTYKDLRGVLHSSKSCSSFCCGDCHSRYCCFDTVWRLSEDDCDDIFSSPLQMILGIISFISLLLLIICCCVCPCCCLYKMCRKPTPVITTTTHTTVINTPQRYPQQPTVHVPPQSYQGNQYPPYQPVPVQPGYGAQPGPTTPYPGQGQPYVAGPPPTYLEATGPTYSPAGPSYGPQPMPYNQAGFMPNQAPYPMQPQPNAPAATPDFISQPAYNPDFVGPPPKTG